MNIVAPPFSLIRTRVSESEWRFEGSDEAWTATEEFDGILEMSRSAGKLGAALRAFLKRYPWHFDALNHYSGEKLREGKTLEAYAFSHAAVATARSCFPREFDPSKHYIPGGFVENRPFLRSLYNLMQCYEALGDYRGASALANELLQFDYEDRMGARMELPKYLLRQGRYQSAADLFAEKKWEGSFFAAEHLYPVVLLHLGRRDESIEAMERLLGRPNIARYLLNPDAPCPPQDSPFGMSSGSDLEGYYFAAQYRYYWATCGEALDLLFEATRKVEAAGWPRYFDTTGGGKHLK
jgi:tetratricopeptide (TPR) repeat protein